MDDRCDVAIVALALFAVVCVATFFFGETQPSARIAAMLLQYF